MNLRALAAELIYEVLDKHRSLNEILPRSQFRCKNEEDRALLQAMSFGVLRVYPRLQFMVNQLLKQPLKAKDNIVLYLICLGIFQLNEMRVPSYAAISETVEAARHLKKPWAVGVINATLRTFQRRSEDILNIVHGNKQAWTAHPEWLMERIQHDWPQYAESIFEANNAIPPLVLRINLEKSDRDAYVEKLKNFESQESTKDMAKLPDFPPSAVILKTPREVTKLPGYEEGLFSVQDAASQCAAFFLDLKPNLRILDACAAPGGKATHILEQTKHCELIAVDIAKERTDKIIENLKRLQLTATVVTEDIKKFAAKCDKGTFDRILLDAPCSALGVIRRHPDIKYLRNPQDISRLALQQLELLHCLWPLLKSKGLLLYATCSILPEENQEVIRQFLKEQPEAVPLPMDIDKDKMNLRLDKTSEVTFGVSVDIGLQVLPGQNDMDGFYYARIGKN